MFWLILIALGLVALVVGGVIAGIVYLLFAPNREPPSSVQIVWLTVGGVAAVVAMSVLPSDEPGVWLIPVLLWLVALCVVRHSAPLKETPVQRHQREAAERKHAKQEQRRAAAREAAERKRAEEAERRAAARKAVAERKRLDSFTKDGLALLGRARAAVAAVRNTEAARDGWLGEAADLDFDADVNAISEALLQARRIEKVAERTKKIPDPSPDDTAMLRDAQKTVKELRSEAKSRVKILDDCATQAREIDRLLAEERRREENDRQREAARRQLAAELFVAEVRPAARESDTADAIAAHVAAFKELKHIVDEKTLREVEGGGTNPFASAITWVRQVLPF